MIRLLIVILCITTSLRAPIHTAVEQWGKNPTGPVRITPPKPLERAYKKMTPVAATRDWSNAQTLRFFKGMRGAHFSLTRTDTGSQAYEVQLHLATKSKRQEGKENLRIIIQQGARGSRVRIFDADGNRITGSVPIIRESHETSHTTLLPWRDNTSVCYSVLLQTIEQRPYVIVIQHSRNKILLDGMQYQPALVADMLRTYRSGADTFGLSERAHCYLDRIEHMRLLPIPYSHDVYALPLSEPVFLTWSAVGADISVS